jgi:hypothetical protein
VLVPAAWKLPVSSEPQPPHEYILAHTCWIKAGCVGPAADVSLRLCRVVVDQAVLSAIARNSKTSVGTCWAASKEKLLVC